MKVAITGANGFIGRRLTMAHIGQSHEVRVLTRGRSIPVTGAWSFTGDLTRPESIPEEFLDGVDVLYHCAAELLDPAAMAAVNSEGTRNLLRKATGRIGRWVQLSSVGVYGPHRCRSIDETFPLAPANEYERSKAAADQSVLDATAAGCFEAVILRPSIVFGGDMPNQSLFQLAHMIERGWFRFIGPPGASANYVGVDNVVDGLQLCARHPAAAGHAFNLSDHRTMESFVATIARCLEVPAPTGRVPEGPVRAAARIVGAIPGSPLTTSRVDALTGRASYPTEKIELRLGYSHALTLEEAMSRTISEWRVSRKVG